MVLVQCDFILILLIVYTYIAFENQSNHKYSLSYTYYLSLVSFPRITTQPRALIPNVTARPAPTDIYSKSALYTCPVSTGRIDRRKREEGNELTKNL